MGTSWSCSVNISKYIFREKEIVASVLKMFHLHFSFLWWGEAVYRKQLYVLQLYGPKLWDHHCKAPLDILVRGRTLLLRSCLEPKKFPLSPLCEKTATGK